MSFDQILLWKMFVASMGLEPPLNINHFCPMFLKSMCYLYMQKSRPNSQKLHEI